MKNKRIIEILSEECGIGTQAFLNPDKKVIIPSVKATLTAMQRAVEEETATLRAEVERLKECEKIVRELASGRRNMYKARQWVKDKN